MKFSPKLPSIKETILALYFVLFRTGAFVSIGVEYVKNQNLMKRDEEMGNSYQKELNRIQTNNLSQNDFLLSWPKTIIASYSL